MIALWLTAGVLVQGGITPEPPPVVSGGGFGWGSVLPKLTRDQEEKLDRALESLERKTKQARTPRERRKKLIEAEQAAEDILAVAPFLSDFPPVLIEIEGILVLIRNILANQLSYPDFRLEMALTLARAREALRALQDDEDEAVVMLLLTH